MSRAAILLSLLAIGPACSSIGGDGGGPSVSQSTSALARETSELAVVFTAPENVGRAAGILDGERPRDFYWGLVTVPVSDALDAGVLFDMADPESRAGFAQVYPGVCNPALEDFSHCFLYESYSSGEEGLSGRIWVQRDADEISISIDVSWEGITDRFGPPLQWHGHDTSMGFAGKFVDVGP